MPAAAKNQVRNSKTKSAGTIAAFFGPKGPLATSLPGYEARAEQIEVAEGIELAMTTGKPCLAEAGTGVGKSLAYLIPAVRAAINGKRTIISTHTIGLQSQLMEKDIPLVLEMFGEAAGGLEPVLMKGRGNFLCKMEMENARTDLFLAADPEFHRIQRWAAKEDCSGDLADLPFSFASWYELTSTPETCRGQECRWYTKLPLLPDAICGGGKQSHCRESRAVFSAILALRISDPNSGILPAYDHVVFDEAHHLEDVATKTFGSRVRFAAHRGADGTDSPHSRTRHR